MTATSATDPAPVLHLDQIEDCLAGWTEAWNRRDADAVAAFCTEDVVWYDPAMAEPLRGRAGAKAFVRETVTAFPDFVVDHLKAPCYSVSEPEMTIAYQMAGTMLGPWEALGFAATGRSMRVSGLDQYRFRDSLLAEITTSYDSLEVARQLGLLPPSGSRIERLAARLQHVGAWVQRRKARATA
jgi:steroid delta-isomerase-like uncharacterized protein